MKKVILLASVVCASISSFARDNYFNKKQEKDILSKGFYLNFGVSYLNSRLLTFNDVDVTSITENQSLGIQPSLEIGNQWYFYTNDKIGAGLKVSWFQFGYSSAKIKDSKSDGKIGTLDLRFFKLAPQFSLKLSEETALDFSVELAPTVLVSGARLSDTTSQASISIGTLITPGVRYRYKKLAVGLDCSFGSIKGASTSDDSSVIVGDIKTRIIQPRLYVGFKF